ncbi:Hypothetical predicted protein [Drosophila guanche]|uniref:Uncharacterized protein n=1 Tax=Drosophila guanche TaxID=7266 RepID=A0A3B0JVW7_DROGU|nr:Hypothetical predicted protein [Drosophila guanche]
MAYHRPNVDGLHDRILDYMEKFYHLRCPSHDEMIFQWFLLEGFYPLFFLLGRPVEELLQSSDEQLDKMNEAMAKYMICAYFRVLFHYAIGTDMDIRRRTLLRCRFVVNVVEVFMLEQHRLLNEPLRNGEKRATQAETLGLCIRTSNRESYSEFYVNQQFPRPDFLAINHARVGLRHYISKTPAETPNSEGFPCPI